MPYSRKTPYPAKKYTGQNAKKYPVKKYPNKKSGRFVIGNVVSFYPSYNYNSPLPSSYRTKIVASNYGSQASGAGTGDNLFTILMNSPKLPYSITVTTPSWAWNGPTVGTQNATGFSQLCNVNTYTKFRVYASSIEIDVLNESVVDPVICTVTPSNTQNVPASTGVALAAPYSKTVDFSSGRSSNGNKVLTHYMPIHKFVGVSSRAIPDDLTGQYVGAYNAQPATLLYWVVNAETADNTTLATNLSFRFKVTYYIEFYNLVSTTLPQT